MSIWVQILGVLFISAVWLAVVIPGLCSPPECGDQSAWWEAVFINGIGPVVLLWIVSVFLWVRKHKKSK